ncbi:MAG: class I SAM-dependent methyltransferase [Candidatus Marithrix sp.]
MSKKEAEFIDRNCCINCGSNKLVKLSSGLFGNDPLRGLIENDPWGESPIPYIENKKWLFARCEDCNQMFHRYVLSPKWNKIRFTSWMSQEAIEKFEASTNMPENRFNKTVSHVQHVLRLEKMTRDIRGKAPVRLLDFGCGWGGFLNTADHFGFVGYGIDRSFDRRKLGQHASIFQNINELINETEPNISFHAISLFEVLEHLDDPLTTLQSLSKLMVTGGILILETPDCTGCTSVTDMSSYRKIHPLDHINAFTSDTIISIAGRAGFSVIKPSISHVTVYRSKVIKSELKQLLHGIIRVNTQKYFYKTCKPHTKHI